jgi:hypothetical protein
MKSNERLRVFAKGNTANGAEQADNFPFFDCADLAARLFQFVEQAVCISIYHRRSTSFYRKGRDGRKVNRAIEKNKISPRRQETRRKPSQGGIILRFLLSSVFQRCGLLLFWMTDVSMTRYPDQSR